jgi:AbrB family looped-hinge helix DNA binding protein
MPKVRNHARFKNYESSQQTLRTGAKSATPTQFLMHCHLQWYMVSLNGMELRIDKAGRIVVPKPLRERLGFRPDTELEAVEQPDGVLLKRVQQRPSMIKVDGLWVHQGTAEAGANWDRVLEDVRGERIESVLKA